MTIGARALAQQIGPDTIRLERLLDAPIERVWAFLVEPDKRRQWFADGPLEAKAGGTLSFTFDHDTLSRADVPYPDAYAGGKGRVAPGYVTEADPPRLLAFHWGDGADIARFELTEEDGKTRMVITHSGLETRRNRVLVSSGWDTHSLVLAKLLAGDACEDFWAAFARAFADYEATLPE